MEKNFGNNANSDGTSVKWIINVKKIETAADNPSEMTMFNGKKQIETKHNANNPPDVNTILPA